MPTNSTDSVNVIIDRIDRHRRNWVEVAIVVVVGLGKMTRPFDCPLDLRRATARSFFIRRKGGWKGAAHVYCTSSFYFTCCFVLQLLF